MQFVNKKSIKVEHNDLKDSQISNDAFKNKINKKNDKKNLKTQDSNNAPKNEIKFEETENNKRSEISDKDFISNKTLKKQK